MLILFDQATPVPIRAYLQGHTIRTAAQQGWDKLKNGDLLTAAEQAGFDLLLTTDKNLRYQQNLTGRKLAILVLGRQQWPQLRPYVQRVVEAINAATRQLHGNRNTRQRGIGISICESILLAVGC